MGYREELIGRLQESGEWNTLTSERRELIEKLDDQTAGAFMAWGDDLQVDHARKLGTLRSPESAEAQNTAKEMLTRGALNFTEVFGGKLIRNEPGAPLELSPLGHCLAEFFKRAERAGFSLFETLEELSQVSTECALIIKKLGESRSG